MNFITAFKISIKGIFSNKTRTFLTMLGVIIGVCTVIVLTSLGQGTTASVTESIESMGSNILSITIRDGGLKDSLSYNEAMEMKEIEGVSNVAPIVNGSATVKYGSNSMDISFEGVDENYQDVRNHTVQSGRFISHLDVDNRNRVTLLGTEVVNELFGGGNPIGEYVYIDGSKFKVVGVLEEKGTSMTGNNDEKVFIPVTTAERFNKSTGIKSIYIQSESSEVVSDVQDKVIRELTKTFGDEEAVRVFNQSDVLSTVSEVTGTLTLMLGGIAAISLLVGGIGIMNIMLVSVRERTREIGIRKAIGAKRKDILVEFLIESSVISGIGGIIGIALGLGGSSLISGVMNIKAVTTPDIIMISFIFSLIVGIFFGIYPANKAAGLKPVDALRYE